MIYNNVVMKPMVYCARIALGIFMLGLKKPLVKSSLRTMFVLLVVLSHQQHLLKQSSLWESPRQGPHEIWREKGDHRSCAVTYLGISSARCVVISGVPTA